MSDNKMLGIVYTNVKHDNLESITRNRTLGSIPFGGRYRLVDFTLSNMVNSGVTDVAALAPTNYHSLMDHLGNGGAWDLSRKKGGLSIFPPFAFGSGIYRGSLEAMGGILPYIEDNDAKYVVICDSDLIANIDMRELLAFHKENNTGISLVYKKREGAAAGQNGTNLVVGASGELLDAVPIQPEDTKYNLYLSVSLFDKDLLVQIVSDTVTHNRYSFFSNILQSDIGRTRARCMEHKGYAARVTCMESYFQSNMDLLRHEVRHELFRPDRPIYTKVLDSVPAKHGLRAHVSNSIVADGCIIEGTVENCIVFRGVKIGRGAAVRNSIIMQDTMIGDGAILDYVIADKDVLVKDSRRLAGYSSFPVYIPKGTHI